MIETLTCKFDGHTWERERKKGKKPGYCPEHKSVTVSEATFKPRGNDEALDILTADVFIDPEFRRKLEAVLDRLDSPDWMRRVEPEDISLMEKVQKALIREFKIRWPTAAHTMGLEPIKGFSV